MSFSDILCARQIRTEGERQWPEQELVALRQYRAPFLSVRRRALRVMQQRLQGGPRWRKESRAGLRRGDIQQPVIGAWRITDIHELQHLLDHPQIARIADEMGGHLQGGWGRRFNVRNRAGIVRPCTNTEKATTAKVATMIAS